MTVDEQYMSRCLQLAACGREGAAPNPMVGAVIVHNGSIIGEGYHRQCGGPHAEVNAIAAVKDEQLLRESTMYVSLEPCAHYGKTPPCADLIISKGIPRVVVGCRDSYTEVDGKGIQKLKAAGVDVTVGVLEKECRELNHAFFTFHTQMRPYIILKWAQSIDGYIDGLREEGEECAPVKFSTAETALRVHRLRALSDAILVGCRTAVLDNPSLTTRFWPGKNPIRLVIDRNGVLDKQLQLFGNSVKTVVFTEVFRDFQQMDGVEQVKVDFASDILRQITNYLYEHKIQRLLVEGGAKTLQAFIDAGLWDEAYVELAPLQLEHGVKAPLMKNARKIETRESFGHQITHFLA